MRRLTGCLVLITGMRLAGQAALIRGAAATPALATGQVAAYTIRAEAGGYFRFSVNGARWVLLEPEGGKVAELANPRGMPYSVLSERGGVYRLEVRGPGRARVELEESRAAGPGDVVRRQAELLFIDAEQARMAGGTERFRVALAGYEGALAGYREIGEKVWEAHCLSSIASVHLAMGEPRKAMAMQEELVGLRRAAGDRVGEGVALSNAGAALEAVGEREAALERYQRSVAVLREARAPEALAQPLTNLGNALRAMGRTEEALAALEEAQRLAVAAGDRQGQYRGHMMLGRVYSTMGDYASARAAYERGLRMAKETNSAAGQATALNNIGTSYAYQRNAEQALVYEERALPLARAAGNRTTEANILNNIGWALEALGRGREAGENYAASLRLSEAAEDKSGMAYAMTNIGRLRAKEGEEALGLLRRALALRREVKDRSGEALTLYQLALAERWAGLLPEALGHSDEALAVVESLRASVRESELRLTYYATVQNQYELNIELLRLTDADPGRTFARSEQARARVLLDVWPGATARATAKLQTELLDAGTVLVEFFLGEERSYAWVVSRERVEMAVLRPQAEIEAAARRYAAALARPDGPAGEAGRALAELVVTPVAKWLENRRVVVVAQRTLQKVPFPLLLPRGEVLMAPSGSALLAMREARVKRRPPEMQLAVLADPVFRAGDARVEADGQRGADLRQLARLLGTRREGAAILALAPAASRLRAFDFSATRELAIGGELGRYRMIHIATHAVLDAARPMESGVVLSMVDRRGTARDGLLRVRDIAALRLPAELVVLSACESGLGKDVSGEGVIGLARAFLQAGAARVVSSLWKVDDAATTAFMTRFYRAMLGPKRLSAAAALREAQEGMRRETEWTAPDYWAGFVLQGEWRP